MFVICQKLSQKKNTFARKITLPKLIKEIIYYDLFTICLFGFFNDGARRLVYAQIYYARRIVDITPRSSSKRKCETIFREK